MACDFLLLIVFVWSILCGPTLGWGDVGHRTVAYLAEQYLNEQAKGLLNDLLPRTQDFDISDAAVWADELRHSERPSTAVWHYVDVKDDPLGNHCNISPLPSNCEEEGCIITAMDEMTDQMHDDSSNQTEAVMFLIHFFGDIHMPLHVEDYRKGGNLINVTFDGRRGNLHGIWDTDMPHKINGIGHDIKHNDEKSASLKWAKHLFQMNKHRPTTAVECSDITKPDVCVKEWAKETNHLNCAVVFSKGLPYIEDEDLGGEYYDDAAPVIAEQIYKAGVRLAAWINALAEQRHDKPALVVQGDRMRDL
ncbi:hypothetical protein N7507_005221 [Penicillium longicatenatum]|nr:hypothetical protein N7507_005221 [Penicillium longicatenatum]